MAATGELFALIYARAGESAESDIGAGTYSFAFAQGDKWFGEPDYFGEFKPVPLTINDEPTLTIEDNMKWTIR